MSESIRNYLHRAITTARGDSLAAIRIPKQVARGIHELLGAPLRSKDESERRRAEAERAADLVSNAAAGVVKREPAPVMVFFEKDRNQNQLTRVEEVLDARGIVYKKLDVTGDAATLSFVTTEAKCENDELPIVFVAGKAIGGLSELVAFDVSGELVKTVFGK